MEKDKQFEERLLELLEQYHHFVFMNAGFWRWFTSGWYHKMNLGEFMQWLKSRK